MLPSTHMWMYVVYSVCLMLFSPGTFSVIMETHMLADSFAQNLSFVTGVS